MKTRNAKSRIILFLFIAGALLAACGPNRINQTPVAEKPEDPTPETQIEEPAASPAESLKIELDGLDLQMFFSASFQALMMRDPEGVLAQGLADVYGLEGAELTDISDAYIRETQQMYVVVLDLLRTYDRDSLSPEDQVSYDVYEWYLDDNVRGQEFMYYDYPATFFPVTAVHEGVMYFFSDLHPLADRQDAEDYVTRLRKVDVKFDQLLEGLSLREDEGITPPQFRNTMGTIRPAKHSKCRCHLSPLLHSLRR